MSAAIPTSIPCEPILTIACVNTREARATYTCPTKSYRGYMGGESLACGHRQPWEYMIVTRAKGLPVTLFWPKTPVGPLGPAHIYMHGKQERSIARGQGLVWAYGNVENTLVSCHRGADGPHILVCGIICMSCEDSTWVCMT